MVLEELLTLATSLDVGGQLKLTRAFIGAGAQLGELRLTWTVRDRRHLCSSDFEEPCDWSEFFALRPSSRSSFATWLTPA